MMNNQQEEAIWQRLTKTLFGIQKTTDEGLFTYKVMEQVRALRPAIQELTWHRFLRWAVPLLGAGVASLVLAARTPIPSTTALMEKALFQQQTPDQDPISGVLEDFR